MGACRGGAFGERWPTPLSSPAKRGRHQRETEGEARTASGGVGCEGAPGSVCQFPEEAVGGRAKGAAGAGNFAGRDRRRARAGRSLAAQPAARLAHGIVIGAAQGFEPAEKPGGRITWRGRRLCLCRRREEDIIGQHADTRQEGFGKMARPRSSALAGARVAGVAGMCGAGVGGRAALPEAALGAGTSSVLAIRRMARWSAVSAGTSARRVI